VTRERKKAEPRKMGSKNDEGVEEKNGREKSMLSVVHSRCWLRYIFGSGV